MSNKSYKVYSDHKGAHLSFPVSDRLEEGYELACAAASNGLDALYRVFEQTSESVTGEQFVTSWSVLNGKVVEHPDPTIPKGHW